MPAKKTEIKKLIEKDILTLSKMRDSIRDEIEKIEDSSFHQKLSKKESQDVYKLSKCLTKIKIQMSEEIDKLDRLLEVKTDFSLLV
jgi:Mg2+ and Co2+ transporter CorA